MIAITNGNKTRRREWRKRVMACAQDWSWPGLESRARILFLMLMIVCKRSASFTLARSVGNLVDAYTRVIIIEQLQAWLKAIRIT